MFDILQYPFIQNALLAGSCVAVVAAVAGYFMIVRGLTFAGHALPNIGFAGAAGAVLLGIDPVIGLFVFTIVAGIGIGFLGERINERDTVVGIIMTIAPAATAVRIVQRPLWAIVIAIVLGVSYTCLGIFLAAISVNWPVSFFIATISFGVYLPVRLLSPLWIGRRARQKVTSTQSGIFSSSQADEQEQSTSVETMGRIQGKSL